MGWKQTTERLPVWRADAEWPDETEVVKASDHDAEVASLKADLANMQAQRDRIAENLRFERELQGGYPFNPTEAQWGGLARDIVWWMRSYPSNQHTPATLMEHLGNLGRKVPAWMGDEAELRTQDHVISKGTVAVLIYKAMLADYRGTQ